MTYNSYIRGLDYLQATHYLRRIHLHHASDNRFRLIPFRPHKQNRTGYMITRGKKKNRAEAEWEGVERKTS